MSYCAAWHHTGRCESTTGQRLRSSSVAIIMTFALCMTCAFHVKSTFASSRKRPKRTETIRNEEMRRGQNTTVVIPHDIAPRRGVKKRRGRGAVGTPCPRAADPGSARTS